MPVQNYITAILVFLIVEQLMTWGFYGRYSLSFRGSLVLTVVTRIDYSNSHGNNAIAKIMMVIVAVLNAGRNSFSFFLLLIVCMGYGVVKPSLGKTMTYVRFLALAHFVFGVIYAVASLNITPENAGPLVLLVILPLAATLTAFYVWTLNSLSLTMKDLLERKQNVKAMMYRKLWYCIIASILVIFAFFFFNSFTFAGRGDPDFVPDHWKTRWFILDGWLNLVYLVDIAYVAYLWRPTVNNRRFAMSDEVSLVTKNDAPRQQLIKFFHSWPRMMKASKWLLLVAPSTRRRVDHRKILILAATHLFHLCRQSQSMIIITLDSRWTAKQSLLSAKTGISGPTMTSLPVTQRNAHD